MEAPLPLVTVCSEKKYPTKSLMKYRKEIFSFNYFISVIQGLLQVLYKLLHFT